VKAGLRGPSRKLQRLLQQPQKILVTAEYARTRFLPMTTL
jgi:hypothetical protein